MPVRSSFDYAIVRVVPRVEREEFVNAGVILYCLSRDFLEARIALDEHRLLALDPTVELGHVRRHLEAIPRICQGGSAAGQLGGLSQKERWHWLTAPRSTVVQLSPVHSGLCDDPERMLDHLVTTIVHPRSP